MITQELLRAYFDYKDGFLIWKCDMRANKVKGIIAGGVNPNGYRYVKFFNNLYLHSRMVFLWHKGYLPKLVDHKDRDKSNDNIENLREGTHAQNSANYSHRTNVTSKFKGVCWCKSRNKWETSISSNRKRVKIGMFINEIDAAIAYNNYAIKLHGEFANLNMV